MPQVYIKDKAEGKNFYIKGELLGAITTPGKKSWGAFIKFPEHLRDYDGVYEQKDIHSVVNDNFAEVLS